MNYVKESIERVVALESCDGRYQVSAKEMMDGMSRYLDGAFDRKEADNGTDKQ